MVDYGSMKISHGTMVLDMDSTNGYGYATDRMLNSLKNIGHEVTVNDSTADVQICFDQPHRWVWNEGSSQYRIGYHPWESTLLKPGWTEIMNEVDEIWTPSALIAEWYRDYAGITRPIFVYEHGVDPIWSPVKREQKGQLKFLHLGAEAARKGGLDTMRAFRKVFNGREDVSLTLKMINPGWNVPQFGRTNIVNDKMNLKELVTLFQEHDVYVYPSWGEGFGLTPLQALATGMPTITVPAWAPYSQFLDPRLNIESKMASSPWPRMHPGKMLAPTQQDLMDNMMYAYENYAQVQDYAQSRVDAVKRYYDWDRLTKVTFDLLAERLEIS